MSSAHGQEGFLRVLLGYWKDADGRGYLNWQHLRHCRGKLGESYGGESRPE